MPQIQKFDNSELASVLTRKLNDYIEEKLRAHESEKMAEFKDLNVSVE